MNEVSQISAPTIVNGLNVDDLMGLIDGVSADPASGPDSQSIRGFQFHDRRLEGGATFHH